ncbi:MAG: YcbK family protein, partial [Hyphomicrobiales bacterium]
KKGLKKLNWFFRDWRRNTSTRMDPELFDMIWEIKTELRSKKPIHVISGFRSARTNKKLRRMGRKVARRSQHIQGRAIDLFFPDAPLVKVRNAALVREIGGVGYYPRSGSKGFVHVDTGSVRHWPRMSSKRLAKIFRDHKRKRRNAPAPVYIAKRKKDTKKPSTRVAAAKPRIKPSIKKPAVYAALSSKARAALTAQIAKSSVPVPRPKPYAVMAEVQGQKDITIQPASANAQVTNFASKRNADDIRRVGTLNNLPLDIRPSTRLRNAFIAAAPVLNDPVPSLWSATRRPAAFETSALRHDGAPQQFKNNLYSGSMVLGNVGMKVASADGMVPTVINPKRKRTFTVADMARINAQQVNRNGKTNLAQTPAVRKMRPNIKPLSKQARVERKRLEAITVQARPLDFD